MDRKCFLKCLQDSHEPIVLSEGREVTVGRSPLTKIKDTRCSKEQVCFSVSTSQLEVTVTHRGGNPSAVNGRLLRKSDQITLKHGDIIELVHGQYKHMVVFEPPPPPSPTKLPKIPKIKDAEISEPPVKKPCLEAIDDTGIAEENKWETIENGKLLVFTSKGLKHSPKIASYDFDWTIVGTSSGRVYPKDKDDWCILLPEIPGHLKKLRADGYKLVLFSNQSGIGTGRIKISDFKSKVERVVGRLGVPMQMFIATGTSLYRKPSSGMWEILVEQYNGGISLDMENSLYCGDAAGRPVNWAPKKKKDFACSDRLFAMNIGIKFFTPEEHFQNARKAPFSLPDFQPMSLPTDIPECSPSTAKLVADKQELAIMVGCPGSGKSFVARRRLATAGYKYVNMDELKSSSKCLEAVKNGLQAGLSVVVDNTNPDRQSRARFLKEAQQRGVVCRCLLMATSAVHARHNNRFRELTDPAHTIIPEMIIRTYEKNYQEPTLEEGFSEVVKVNFIPQFSDPKLKSIYEKFLI